MFLFLALITSFATSDRLKETRCLSLQFLSVYTQVRYSSSFTFHFRVVWYLSVYDFVLSWFLIKWKLTEFCSYDRRPPFMLLGAYYLICMAILGVFSLFQHHLTIFSNFKYYTIRRFIPTIYVVGVRLLSRSLKTKFSETLYLY